MNTAVQWAAWLAAAKYNRCLAQTYMVWAAAECRILVNFGQRPACDDCLPLKMHRHRHQCDYCYSPRHIPPLDSRLGTVYCTWPGNRMDMCSGMGLDMAMDNIRSSQAFCYF